MRVPEEILKLRCVHSEKLASLLGGENAPVVKAIASRVIFICFTNRSGSNYLAQVIGSSGITNIAGEFLNYDTVLHQQRLRGFSSLREHFISLTTTLGVNGTLACKLGVTQIALLHRAGILEEIAQVAKFLLIERSDLLGQAISMQIAAQTGQWTSEMKSRISPDMLKFDKADIERTMRSIMLQQGLFRLFFGMNGMDYFHVNYESLLSDGPAVTKMLAEWLGYPHLKFDFNLPKIKKQAGEMNAVWRRGFLEATTPTPAPAPAR